MATTLQELRLLPGTPIQLEVPSHKRCFPVEIVGYLPGETLLITTPQIQGSHIELKDDEKLVLRLFIEGKGYCFHSVIVEIHHSPFPYLHLQLPTHIEQDASRMLPRIWTQLKASVHTQTGAKSALLNEVSIGGGKLAFSEPSLQVGQQLSIDVELPVGHRQLPAHFEARVCSDTEKPDEQGRLVFYYGIEFVGLAPDADVALKGFVYAEMIRTGVLRL